MAPREIISREPAAAFFAICGLTVIAVLASLGEPVLGGLLFATGAGYLSGRSLSDAGRNMMYRTSNDAVAIAWMASILLVTGLALDWIGLIGPPHDVSRLDAFACGAPALAILGFVHGAWHEHLDRHRAD